MAERAQGRMPMHPEIHLTLFWPARHHYPYGTQRKPDVQVVGHNAQKYEATCFFFIFELTNVSDSCCPPLGIVVVSVRCQMERFELLFQKYLSTSGLLDGEKVQQRGTGGGARKKLIA